MKYPAIIFLFSFLIIQKCYSQVEVELGDQQTPNNGISPNHLTLVGNLLFFTGIEESTGSELWVSDGTVIGTHLVKDIRTGGIGSKIENLTAVNNLVFFVASDGVHGFEVWRSDGTEEGTFMLKDIYPGANESTKPLFLTNVNGTLYFYALTQNVTIYECLWRSDGTISGTKALVDSMPDYNVKDIFPLGDKLFFTGRFDNNIGNELGVSDGTIKGTGFLKDINKGYYGSNISFLGTIDSNIIFSAFDSTYGNELRISNGRIDGTHLLKDINPGLKGSFVYSAIKVNGVLYFSANLELWRTDGTPDGTYSIINMTTDSKIKNGGIGHFWSIDNVLFFKYYENWNPKLAKTDGTKEGTKKITNLFDDEILVSSLNKTGSPKYIYMDNNLVCECDSSKIEKKREYDLENGRPIYTSRIKNLCYTSIQGFCKTSDFYYFLANDIGGIMHLWKSDGTVLGTKAIIPLRHK